MKVMKWWLAMGAVGLTLGCTSAESDPSGSQQSSGEAASGQTPLCGEPCQDPKGCFPCAEGAEATLDGTAVVCQGGCWSAEPAAGPLCGVYGRGYAPGGAAPSTDGCNACTCALQAGEPMLGCTTMACGCEDLTGFNQVESDLEACAERTPECPPNTEWVVSDCGCGCLQNPSCAEEYDCSGEACDREVIQAYCPFSTLHD
ncbi:MAG: hypothetical protein KIT72_04410 [Polyangiaceae bacterium]|nr:hypothetical protein [Polyangiaceae bacterium]MCW5789646.1 hypothetical protein [Polyangiaceae bacterium]